MAKRSQKRSRRQASNATDVTRSAARGIDQINHLNSGLMIGSALLAFVLPFELLIFSYAVLGPLHYLTQISWLHDRGYFTTGRWDFVPLGALGLVLFFSDDTEWLASGSVIFAAFGISLGFAFLTSTRAKILLAIAVLAVSPFVRNWALTDILFTLFLVTVIHVFVFTGFFILQGSFKSGRASGFISFGVFLLCAATLLFHQPTSADYDISTYTASAADAFFRLIDALGSLLGATDRDGLIAITRFLAFAYTYHYLNWFSKTGIIRWHDVSRGRMAGIGVLYAASLALYGYDYQLGLVALLFLSNLHVLLEFPLDYRVITDVGRSVGRLGVRIATPGAVAEQR